jgi:hypothetical protein
MQVIHYKRNNEQNELLGIDVGIIFDLDHPNENPYSRTTLTQIILFRASFCTCKIS